MNFLVYCKALGLIMDKKFTIKKQSMGKILDNLKK